MRKFKKDIKTLIKFCFSLAIIVYLFFFFSVRDGSSSSVGVLLSTRSVVFLYLHRLVWCLTIFPYLLSYIKDLHFLLFLTDPFCHSNSIRLSNRRIGNYLINPSIKTFQFSQQDTTMFFPKASILLNRFGRCVSR